MKIIRKILLVRGLIWFWDELSNKSKIVYYANSFSFLQVKPLSSVERQKDPVSPITKLQINLNESIPTLINVSPNIIWAIPRAWTIDR